MSTKIYDAWRISKEVDILNILKEGKEIFRKSISGNRDFLYLIHARVTFEAAEAVEKDPQNHSAKYALEKNKEGGLDEFWLERTLEKFEISQTREPADVHVLSSIFYDDDYWYIKFFMNSNWAYKPLKEFVNEFKLEDFHYQDQSDPPEDIEYEEYEKRSDKWDELLGEEGNYREGFQFTMFDARDLRNLISKNYYKGLKTNEELYSHLAYKFDKK